MILDPIEFSRKAPPAGSRRGGPPPLDPGAGGPHGQRSAEHSPRGEADPVAVKGWLEVDRLAAENRDLHRRIDRTLEYTDELLRGPLNATTATVARAVHNSLCTPSSEAAAR